MFKRLDNQVTKLIMKLNVLTCIGTKWSNRPPGPEKLCAFETRSFQGKRNKLCLAVLVFALHADVHAAPSISLTAENYAVRACIISINLPLIGGICAGV